MRREEFGWPGHFIASARCRFHRHTHVNGYCISTVGDYHPAGSDGPPETVGVGRLFETMVFVLGTDGEPVSWNDIDAGAYNDREAANAGHERLVNKWAEATEQACDGTDVRRTAAPTTKR